MSAPHEQERFLSADLIITDSQSHRRCPGQQSTSGGMMTSTGSTGMRVARPSRVRVLAWGKPSKNDPNDARSVAIAALGRESLAEVHREDEAAILRMLAKRHRELTAERVRRIELPYSAWEADVLPLNYTRRRGDCSPAAPSAIRRRPGPTPS